MGVLGEMGNISPWKAVEPFLMQLRFNRGVVLGRPPPDSCCEPALRPSLRVFVFRSQERCAVCEGHGHGPWTKGLNFLSRGLCPVDERGLGQLDLHTQSGD